MRLILLLPAMLLEMLLLAFSWVLAGVFPNGALCVATGTTGNTPHRPATAGMLIQIGSKEGQPMAALLFGLDEVFTYRRGCVPRLPLLLT